MQAARAQRILGPLPPEVARALERVEPGAFLPRELAALAGADAPLPFHRSADDVALAPSPRLAAVLLALLELGHDERLLVVGAESGWLAAMALEAGASLVRIVEPDREVAEVARRFAERAGVLGRVEVRAGPPAREAEGIAWERALLLDPRRTLTAALGERLGELGFAVALAHTSQGWEVVKTLRSGEGLAEMRARLPLKPGLPEGAGSFLPQEARASLDGLLALEEMAGNVWRGAAPSHAEGELRAGVEVTWKRPDAELAALAPEAKARRELAKAVFHLGFLHQAAGDLEGAADLYERSHEVLPSAEALTFLGWTRSFEGRTEDAIALCERAIATDPTLGNPYNDIGAYLLQLDRPREALGWLTKALGAPRYDAPFFPHLNLARAHLALGDAAKARIHLRKALELNPGYAPAKELLRRLEG